jgi:UDP-glucose 4-epimerase
VQRAAGSRFPVRHSAPRPGDPAVIVADAGRLRQTFGWQPHFDDLDRIVADALAWERRLSAGSDALQARQLARG